MRTQNKISALLFTAGFIATSPVMADSQNLIIRDPISVLPIPQEVYGGSKQDQTIVREGTPENNLFKSRFGMGIFGEMDGGFHSLPFDRPWHEMHDAELRNLINAGTIMEFDFLDNLTVLMIYSDMPLNMKIAVNDHYGDNERLFSSEFLILTPAERGALIEKLLKRLQLPQKDVKGFDQIDLKMMMGVD